MDADNARLQHGHERRVLRQDAELAFDAGGVHLLHVAGKQLALGRNQREMESSAMGLPCSGVGLSGLNPL